MLERVKKAARVSIIFIVGGLILAYLNIYGFVFKRPSKTRNFTKAKKFAWKRVDLGKNKNAVSSDGSKYYMLAKKGGGRNLMILFSGGGASWDAETAFQPMGLRNLVKGKGLGYYFGTMSFINFITLKGILDSKKEDNPFKDWDAAYIPYTTGDFHIGNCNQEYTLDGKRMTMRHNGRNNALACLEWIFENFKEPEKVFICGDSAGAFGSAFWTPYIAKHYSSSKLYQFSDGAFIKTWKWPEITDNVWRAECEKNFGYKIDDDMIKSVFLNNYRLLGDRVTIMHLNTLYDNTLSAFEADVNGKGKLKDLETNEEVFKEWSAEMLESTKAISSAVPCYYYYITDYGFSTKKHSTPHTLIRTDLKAEQDGVRFVQWLEDMAINDKRYSVGEKYLNSGEFIERT
jgi:hypothetical protein